MRYHYKDGHVIIQRTTTRHFFYYKDYRKVKIEGGVKKLFKWYQESLA